MEVPGRPQHPGRHPPPAPCQGLLDAQAVSFSSRRECEVSLGPKPTSLLQVWEGGARSLTAAGPGPDAPSSASPPHCTPAPGSTTSRPQSASENQSPLVGTAGGTWEGHGGARQHRGPSGGRGLPRTEGERCAPGSACGWCPGQLTLALGLQLARCRSGGQVGGCQSPNPQPRDAAESA